MTRQLERQIDACVKELFHPLPPCEVTEEARKATEKRLCELPLLCERFDRVEGLEACLISMEIGKMKRALEEISSDPNYDLIPALYFQGLKTRITADICHCDKSTIWRNRNRLLDRLALLLFGVAAWGEKAIMVDTWDAMKNW